jgi:dihydrofolate synthase / folylpolyglutamate synthase
MTYQVLREAGYTVGVFLSPHLLDVRERFLVDDVWISDEDFIFLQNRIASLNLSLSRFEKYVATAFLYFQMKKVDYAVIEVGV